MNTLTIDQIQAYIKFVETIGATRQRQFGQADATAFAMGAACLFYFLDRDDKLPAAWILRPMMDQAPFDGPVGEPPASLLTGQVKVLVEAVEMLENAALEQGECHLVFDFDLPGDEFEAKAKLTDWNNDTITSAVSDNFSRAIIELSNALRSIQ